MGSTSVQFHGKRRSAATYYKVSNTSNTPSMSCDISWEISRPYGEASSTVRVKVSGNLWRLCKFTSGTTNSRFDSETGNYGNSSFGYYIKIYANVNGQGNKRIVYKPSSPSKWTSSGYGESSEYFDFDWASGTDGIPVSLYVDCGCYSKEGCSSGNATYNKVFYITPPSYNPSTPATNVGRGCVFSTNNNSGSSARSIEEYIRDSTGNLDSFNSIWFDWWDQSDGTPDANKIDHFNVDCYPSNDVDKAYSVDITDHYSQNTRINMYTMMQKYKLTPGSTLYCWVNTCTKGGAWLGRVYLGSIKFKKRGAVYEKVSNSNKEMSKLYLKDTSGVQRKVKYICYKDSSGNKRIIDMFTELY